MPIEQRVMNAPVRPSADRPSGIKPKVPVETPEPEAPKGKKKLRLIIVAVVVALALGAAYFFFLRGDGTPEPEPAPEPGAVLTVEAMSINLADGHYLRLGLGLQLTLEAGAHGEIDAAKARDAAITLFSGRTVAEIADPTTREALKAELLTVLTHAYEGEVMDVYLTDYVTQ